MTTKGGRRWNECKFTNWFCRCITKCNGMTFAVVGSKMQSSGWPDRYIAHARWSGWIEFKSASNPLSDIQRKILHNLKARGVNCYVAIIRRGDFFELQHVNGKTLASQDLLPFIGHDVEAGRMFLQMLVDNNDKKTFKHTPACR